MSPTIQWTNDNNITVRLTGERPLILDKLNDLGVSGNAQVVRAPGQDGESAFGLTRTAREINITGHAYAIGREDYPIDTALDDLKNLLCQAFDPKYFGTLSYTFDSREWQIRCRPVAMPAFGKPINGYCSLDVDLRSEKWYWVSSTPDNATLGKVTPNWFFPYIIMPTPFAFVYADALYYNDTPYELPPVITVFNTGAAAEITNTTTGKTLKFNQAVGANQKLVIDVEELTAILYEYNGAAWVFKANALSWLTLDSDITTFKAVPGENAFTISHQQQSAEPVMSISFNKQRARVY